MIYVVLLVQLAQSFFLAWLFFTGQIGGRVIVFQSHRQNAAAEGFQVSFSCLNCGVTEVVSFLGPIKTQPTNFRCTGCGSLMPVNPKLKESLEKVFKPVVS